MLTWRDAIETVLRRHGTPQHVRAIADEALSEGLVQSFAEHAWATVSSTINKAIKEEGERCPFVKLQAGEYLWWDVESRGCRPGEDLESVVLQLLRNQVGAVHWSALALQAERVLCLPPALHGRYDKNVNSILAKADLAVRVGRGTYRWDGDCESDRDARLHRAVDVSSLPPLPIPSPADARRACLSACQRARLIFAHLERFGEIADEDLDGLVDSATSLASWLDSLLTRRPMAYVVTPFFLELLPVDGTPDAFALSLAAAYVDRRLERVLEDSLDELEDHIWDRFGSWHLKDVNAETAPVDGYLRFPIRESASAADSERLDLLARLSADATRLLSADVDLLSMQVEWSANVKVMGSYGPLSTQLCRKWKRPLLLSTVELLVADDGQVLIGEMERTDVTERSYIVAGLPLCRDGEWESAATLDREAAAERLFQHPVAAALLQFEVHRLFAGLSGDVAALIHLGGGVAQLELDGAGRGPLWRQVRSMLEQVGYWPVGASTQDSLWASAVHVMLKNLELLDVFERDGDVLRLTDDYQSKIKAHPGHLQNRGEKPYRVRLSQFLAALHGGQA